MTSDLDAVIAEAEEQLATLFSRVRVIWKDAAAQIHPDLKPVGYKILSTVVRLGETSASALAEHLDTDKAVVSRQVRMLEEAGLVISRADENDGRARVLAPTADAVERVRGARSRQQAKLRDLLRSLPVDDVTTFTRVLRLITEN